MSLLVFFAYFYVNVCMILAIGDDPLSGYTYIIVI